MALAVAETIRATIAFAVAVAVVVVVPPPVVGLRSRNRPPTRRTDAPERPGRALVAVVLRAADQGGPRVRGQRDADPEAAVAVLVGAGQLAALLLPPRRIA